MALHSVSSLLMRDNDVHVYRAHALGLDRKLHSPVITIATMHNSFIDMYEKTRKRTASGKLVIPMTTVSHKFCLAHVGWVTCEQNMQSRVWRVKLREIKATSLLRYNVRISSLRSDFLNVIAHQNRGGLRSTYIVQKITNRIDHARFYSQMQWCFAKPVGAHKNTSNSGNSTTHITYLLRWHQLPYGQETWLWTLPRWHTHHEAELYHGHWAALAELIRGSIHRTHRAWSWCWLTSLILTPIRTRRRNTSSHSASSSELNVVCLAENSWL